MENARKEMPKLKLAEDQYACVAGADILVLATDWNQFRKLDLPRLEKTMKAKNFVDLRNLYEPKEMKKARLELRRARARLMRIVVTGAAGFLGSHLTDRLLAEGHEVVGLDNLVTGDVRNIAHLAGNRKFRFVYHDVTEYIYLDGPVDAILHFASPASPIDYLQIPIQTLKVGALGTHKALGLARAKGARFLLASTSEVYGDPLVHPQPETYWGNVNPVGPARLLRRGQALRRGDDDRVPELPHGRHADRPDLQHVRPADAAERRAHRALPHRPGAPRRAAHGLRRRLADALVLLRLRPHRGDPPPPRVGPSATR